MRIPYRVRIAAEADPTYGTGCEGTTAIVDEPPDALYDPASHEALVDAPWNVTRVGAAVREIVSEAEEAFDEEALWPIHPRDLDDDPEPPPLTALYLGAAGMIWALDELARRDAAELRRDYAPVAAGLLDRHLTAPDFGEEAVPSLLMGETGILLVADRLAPDADRRKLLLERIRANVGHESNELMWGTPGTALAAHAMLQRTGEERWRDAWLESAEQIWAEWGSDPDYPDLWEQDLYGRTIHAVGPVHGFAGSVLVLWRGRDLLGAERTEELVRRVARATAELAQVDDGLANWPPALEPPRREGQTVRVQWCHGAPGVVASLVGLMEDELALAGGELTWRAGPLVKGGGLCHGTAGNGYAFLKLFRHTGDERWLERARAFAMHALAQVEAARAEFGRGRYSLWTGDVGTAIYALDCIDGRADVPTIDVF